LIFKIEISGIYLLFQKRLNGKNRFTCYSNGICSITEIKHYLWISILIYDL